MKRIRFIVVGSSNDATAFNLANNLTTVQKEFDFSVHEQIMNLPKGVNAKRPVPIEALENVGKKIIANKYPGEYPVILCECSLEGDLFSSYDGNVAIITTCDWTRKFSPYPAQRYLAYILADVLMSFHIDTEIHEETRGCPGDYCDNREDINIGLAKCSYCRDCQALILRELSKGEGITISRLAAIYRILDFAAARKFCFVLMPFARNFDAVYERSIYPIFPNTTVLINKVRLADLRGAVRGAVLI